MLGSAPERPWLKLLTEGNHGTKSVSTCFAEVGVGAGHGHKSSVSGMRSRGTLRQESSDSESSSESVESKVGSA